MFTVAGGIGSPVIDAGVARRLRRMAVVYGARLLTVVLDGSPTTRSHGSGRCSPRRWCPPVLLGPRCASSSAARCDGKRPVGSVAP